MPGSELQPAGRPSVRLSLPAAASHVRTARLISVSVARRWGLDGIVLDEFRLAVGEACAQVLSGTGDGDVLRLEIVDEGGFLTVSVFTVLQHGSGSSNSDPSNPPVTDDLSLAVLRELVPSLQVLPGRFDLTWPTEQRLSDPKGVT